MEFVQRDEYYWASDCGKYSVCKWNMPEAIYFAYKRMGEKFVRLGETCKTAKEARELCRQDAEEVTA